MRSWPGPGPRSRSREVSVPRASRVTRYASRSPSLRETKMPFRPPSGVLLSAKQDARRTARLCSGKSRPPPHPHRNDPAAASRRAWAFR